MYEITEQQIANFRKSNDFLEKFKKICGEKLSKLPYHINLLDELHANENSHSRILGKLLQQKTNERGYEILTSFVEYLGNKGIAENKNSFTSLTVEEPRITQESQRIDVWIQDKSYTLIIENKVHGANDQDRQLERYIEISKQSKSEEQIYVVYLPPTDEKEPDEGSWGKYLNSGIHKNRYLKLSFRDDILLWLKETVCPNIRIKDVYLRSAVEQYIDHLEGIFSLRTINNKMNMELQKFIEEEFDLSESSIPQKYKVVEGKIGEFKDTVRKLENYLAELLLPIKSIENDVRKEFPKLSVGNVFNSKSYYDIYVHFEISGFKFPCILSFLLNDNSYQSGVYTHQGKKEEEIKKFLQPLFEKSIIKEDEEWYGYKDIPDKDAAWNHFKNLIYTIIEEKNKWQSK